MLDFQRSAPLRPLRLRSINPPRSGSGRKTQSPMRLLRVCDHAWHRTCLRRMRIRHPKQPVGGRRISGSRGGEWPDAENCSAETRTGYRPAPAIQTRVMRCHSPPSIRRNYSARLHFDEEPSLATQLEAAAQPLALRPSVDVPYRYRKVPTDAEFGDYTHESAWS